MSAPDSVNTGAMSKTKLAILVFCLTFALNGAAFLFSKKTFQVEEVKNVWLYELPLTASPLDAYVSLDLGPHQGVVGTFFMPDSLIQANPDAPHPITNSLADSWKWDAASSTLHIQLKKNLVYSNGDALNPSDWVKSHEFLVSQTPVFPSSAVWTAWKEAHYEATQDGIQIKFSRLTEEFDLEKFLADVLTHPLSGVIHPKNLEALSSGKPLTKDWISSGPYQIWKWNPKEIEMVSRDNFPGGMRKDFFRTLKFQSAPVKNPSCDFMVGRASDATLLKDHNAEETDSVLHVFWICRSWKQNAFCQDPKNRELFSKLISGTVNPNSNLMKDKKVRFRIPTGSDDFRTEIRTKIQSVVELAGGEVAETSYFFKPSTDTDIELEFVVTPRMKNSTDFATSLALLSTRLGAMASSQPNLVGEIMNFPIQIFTKMKKGPIFPEVFLDPDLEEKKLSL